MNELQEAIKNDKVAVIKTDTLYGIIASADSEVAVEKVFHLKNRNRSKACIVLIADTSNLKYGDTIAEWSEKYEGPVSVIVPASYEPDWITRGGDSVAYRIPKNQRVIDILRATGPVIAPSANPEGLEPARDIAEAKGYFGQGVAIYQDDGPTSENIKPSTIIKISGDKIDIIR